MRVLHVVPSYLPATRYGGPIYSVHGLARAQVHAGHIVDICTTSIDGFADSNVMHGSRVDMDGVGVYYFASKVFRRLYYSAAMSRFLSGSVSSYDICHTHSIYLWPTWKASILAHRSGVPSVISPRGMLVPELIAAKNRLIKQVWIRTIEYRNFQRASGIHFTSDLEASAAQTYLPASLQNQAIIANGIECSRSAEEIPTFSNRDSILFLGRINWKKNLDVLIKAVEPIEDSKLLVAGPADQDELDRLSQLVADRNLAHRITFFGPADAEQKTKLFSQAKVLVLCSINENFGNVVIEALANGCPVVVNDSVGAAALVKTYGAGIVVNSDNLELTNAITHMLTDESAWQQYQLNGLLLIKEKFLWIDVAAQMCDFYRRIIDQ